VEGVGLPPCPVILRERSAFRASWPLGKAVVEVEADGKAAQEMTELKDWLLSQLQVCTPDRVQNQEVVV
jgi:chromosome partitioning protein